MSFFCPLIFLAKYETTAKNWVEVPACVLSDRTQVACDYLVIKCYKANNMAKTTGTKLVQLIITGIYKPVPVVRHYTSLALTG